MTKNSIIGYPRVGSHRQLKFWTEDYFKGQLSEQMLQSKAAALRKEQWQRQAQEGIDFIPSNDFSFYDGVLDTAFMLNAVPERYQALGLSALDTYFALARGYQGEKGDVKALPMRKWFNTNYHYMVPQLDDEMQISLNSSQPFSRFAEALDLGIMTKPVLIGPFTLLMLADYQGNKKRADFVDEVVAVYQQVFERFNEMNCPWLQLDEPSLVVDLTKEEKQLFLNIYQKLLPAKKNLKILLQTYFGDIRDVYKDVISLDFNALGLDFIEGKLTEELIKEQGFPADTLLFAGVVNGKNIWRNDYKQSLGLLQRLTKYLPQEKIVINTSCSLLHVPYSLENETKMSEQHKKHFAFAQEKLQELAVLKSLFSNPDYQKEPLYQANLELISAKKAQTDPQIAAKIASLTEDDFTRNPAFKEREALQEKKLNLPLLPTTTIGSFPQTAEVKNLRLQLKNGQISTDQYQKEIKKAIADCISLQEKISLDVLVHGEYERNDMVEYFGENLAGFLFTEKAWVQSYGTRCVKPPIIYSDIKRLEAITVSYSTFAQSLTSQPVKGMLTGPVTILNWSFPREDVENKVMAFQIALALQEEVLELESAGIAIIQVDEAALKEKLPLRKSDWQHDYLEWAIPAFRLVHARLQPETQLHTHMCYSEFAEIIKDIDAMDADVISFEAARSHHAIVDALVAADFRTKVGPGVYDIHSPRIPSEEEIREIICEILEKIPPAQLWINPDCGLKTRQEQEVAESLTNLVAAAKNVRKKLQTT
ncbi:MAG: 5-methyltetrahydropteroyltriglutamate--homocysteine S-methyltransferase [Bacillota bacterium]|jgi:5-methyltetrahydropteroyltriglutamate--homocysteine methyltransferase